MYLFFVLSRIFASDFKGIELSSNCSSLTVKLRGRRRGVACKSQKLFQFFVARWLCGEKDFTETRFCIKPFKQTMNITFLVFLIFSTIYFNLLQSEDAHKTVRT
jgi:hypothetical protein